MKMNAMTKNDPMPRGNCDLICHFLGMSDWRNWLGHTCPVEEVVGLNPGRDTCLVWNYGKSFNPSILGGWILNLKRPAGGHLRAVFCAILGINLLL